MAGIVLNRAGLHEQVCDAIRDGIVTGEYQAGQRLNIDQLAREMGVSSTPVREALARLVSERLVVFQSKRGYSVTPAPDEEWLRSLFEVRLLLEPYAARIGADLRDQDSLQELEQAQQMMESLDLQDPNATPGYLRFNQQFHRSIVDSARNRVLSEQYNSLSYHTQIGLVYGLGLHDIPQVISEHYPIIAAYREGDGEAAAAALIDHIHNGRDRTLSFVVSGVNSEAKQGGSTED